MSNAAIIMLFRQILGRNSFRSNMKDFFMTCHSKSQFRVTNKNDYKSLCKNKTAKRELNKYH